MGPQLNYDKVIVTYAGGNSDLQGRLNMADRFAMKNDPQNLGRAIDTLQDALDDVPLPQKVHGALEAHIIELRKRYMGMVESEAIHHYNRSL